MLKISDTLIKSKLNGCKLLNKNKLLFSQCIVLLRDRVCALALYYSVQESISPAISHDLLPKFSHGSFRFCLAYVKLGKFHFVLRLRIMYTDTVPDFFSSRRDAMSKFTLMRTV